MAVSAVGSEVRPTGGRPAQTWRPEDVAEHAAHHAARGGVAPGVVAPEVFRQRLGQDRQAASTAARWSRGPVSETRWCPSPPMYRLAIPGSRIDRERHAVVEQADVARGGRGGTAPPPARRSSSRPRARSRLVPRPRASGG